MRRYAIISIGLVLCFLLSSCAPLKQSKNTSDSTERRSLIEKTKSEPISTYASTTQSETKLQPTITRSEWAAAYKKYLLGKIKSNELDIELGEYDSTPSSYFTLYYIDDDDIPEIMVMDEGAHIGTATIVTYNNGIVKAFPGLGSNGVVYFREKENVIVDDYLGSGTHHITVYHLSDESLVTDWQSSKYDTTWFENGGKTAYTVYGAVVDAKEYQEQYDRFVPKWYSTDTDNMDACPESDWDSREHIDLTSEEIEQYFSQWIEE